MVSRITCETGNDGGDEPFTFWLADKIEDFRNPNENPKA
jgi:hypothetical protein